MPLPGTTPPEAKPIGPPWFLPKTPAPIPRAMFPIFAPILIAAKLARIGIKGLKASASFINCDVKANVDFTKTWNVPVSLIPRINAKNSSLFEPLKTAGLLLRLRLENLYPQGLPV